MYSPFSTGMEVLLKIRFEGARFSGQRKFTARGGPLNSSIKPLTSKRFPSKTGMATSSLLLVTIGSCHKMCPFVGSREDSDLSVQTINCLRPAEVMTMGE